MVGAQITTANHEKEFPGLRRLLGDQTLTEEPEKLLLSRTCSYLWGFPRDTRYCVIPVKKMIIRGGKSRYLKKSNIFTSWKE